MSDHATVDPFFALTLHRVLVKLRVRRPEVIGRRHSPQNHRTLKAVGAIEGDGEQHAFVAGKWLAVVRPAV
jgi:hypothetical protein